MKGETAENAVTRFKGARVLLPQHLTFMFIEQKC